MTTANTKRARNGWTLVNAEGVDQLHPSIREKARVARILRNSGRADLRMVQR